MSRMHRVRRRASHSVVTHDRARTLAAQRIDAPLAPAESAWLEEHLAGCTACRSAAASYAADRVALRGLRDLQPEPPRDLWARTSAAIERESASRGGRVRRSTGSRRGPALGLLSAVAVIAVVAGATILSGMPSAPSTAGVPAGGTPAIAAVPSATQPGPTPIAVGAGSVGWVGTSADGALAYNVTDVDEVCAAERQPDCAPVADRDSRRVELAIRPKSISLSPVKNEAVVVGTDATGRDSVVVIVLPSPAPSVTPQPSPTPASTPSQTPIETAPGSVPPATPVPPATSVPTATPAASDEPTANPSASTEPTPPSSPSLSPTATPATTPEATPEATPVVTPEVTPVATPEITPEPSVARELAIVSGVKVVGQSAAYSPDGGWFAFSARPSDESAGPDIYVWRVGDQLARAITNDHASVFASWAGNLVLGSRAEPDPASGGVAARSFFLDPQDGSETEMDGAAWRPTVDPTGHWAVTWDGTIKVAPDGLTAIPGDGSLVLRDFTDGVGVDTTGQPAGVVVDGGPVSEFDVRWDETGTWLAVWLADASDPSIGRLSLLQVDPATGALDRPHGAPHDVTALPGFSIANGRLAWATPPGQGGEGSRVQIVAWSDNAVGAVESGPVEGVVVVH